MKGRNQRRVLVTGGTRGIGFAIARELHRTGLEVTVTGTRSGGRGPAGCRYLQVDFSDSGEMEAFAQRVRGMNFSVLINNAGVNEVGPIEKVSAEVYDRIQRINVRAPFLLSQAVLPGMKRHRFGRMVNIGSILGLVGKMERSAYCTSKAALLGLTRVFALEGAGHNVLVNCVSPGFIDTDLTRRILGSSGMKRMAATVPLGRAASPSEIAPMVRFLVSDENSYMTGQNVVVDGGFTCA